MVASAIKEYGAESCEAVACLEKYIHDIKLPAQERLEIAADIWHSWSTGYWFPWNTDRKQNLDRSNIGWGRF